MCRCLPNFLHGFVKDLRNPQDVYACFRLSFIISAISGIIPFYKSTNQAQQLQASFFSYLMIIIRLFCYSCTLVYCIVREQTLLEYFYKNQLSKLTDKMQTTAAMFCLILILVISLLKRQHLLQLMSDFHNLEKQFLNNGVSFRQKLVAAKINRTVTAFVGVNLLFILYSCYGVIERKGLLTKMSFAITLYSPHITVCGVITLFTSAMQKIADYFYALDKILKNTQECDERSISTLTLYKRQHVVRTFNSFSLHTIVNKNPAEIYQSTMDIHQSICNAAGVANKYFTYQLLTIIGIAFLIILFDSYYILETILGKSSMRERESIFKKIEFLTFFSCQMLLYLIAIVLIVECSTCFIRKSEKISNTVLTLLNKSSNVAVKEKLQQFSIQLTHLKMGFSAAGLFNIDRTLYFTIVGALTTYLIILLQFTSNAPEATQNTPCLPIATTSATTAVHSNITNATVIGS